VTEHATESRREIASWLQVVVMIIAVVTVFYAVGKRDQVLTNHTESIKNIRTDQAKETSELRSIVFDLAKIAGDNTASFRVAQNELTNIKARLDRLETQRTTP